MDEGEITLKNRTYFFRTMKKIDDIRNENILETFPELAEKYEKN
jgi:hypothetical protein